MTCFDGTATSGVNGGFSISGLPTAQGPLRCAATFVTVEGETLIGSSAAVAPVPEGATLVGSIRILPAAFETDIGTGLILADDDFEFIAFTEGFTFPFAGTVQTGIFVNSNGNLTFEAGDFTFDPIVPSGVVDGLPRISPLFTDIFPLFPDPDGGVYVNQFADRFVVTWNHLPQFFEGGDNTFQAILFSDGRIQFGYDGLTADGFGNGYESDTLDISVGSSPGGSPPLITVDYSVDVPFSSAPGDAILENFSLDGSFDLDGGFLLFRPTGPLAYDVDFVPPLPATGTSTLLGLAVGESGTPLPNCVITVEASNDPTFSAQAVTAEDGSFAISGVPVGGMLSIGLFNESGSFLGSQGLKMIESGVSYGIVVAPAEFAAKE